MLWSSTWRDKREMYSTVLDGSMKLEFEKYVGDVLDHVRCECKAQRRGVGERCNRLR